MLYWTYFLLTTKEYFPIKLTYSAIPSPIYMYIYIPRFQIYTYLATKK